MLPSARHQQKEYIEKSLATLNVNHANYTELTYIVVLGLQRLLGYAFLYSLVLFTVFETAFDSNV